MATGSEGECLASRLKWYLHASRLSGFVLSANDKLYQLVRREATDPGIPIVIQRIIAYLDQGTFGLLTVHA